MKEIGGYFELEKLDSNEYYKDLISVNCGRNALLYILKSKRINKIYIPYYLCNSISLVCANNKFSFEYYNVDNNFLPILKKEFKDNEYLYIVNYFGQLSDQTILELKLKYKNIIIDNVQAFFQKPILGIDTIYSCRKFFGVPDGAYLFSTTLLNEELCISTSSNKMKHILGRFEGDAFDYYDYYKENDNSFRYEPLMYMSKITHNILGAINYDYVISKRNNNYSFLNTALSMSNKIEFVFPNGPFAYPLYIENGIEVRKIMAKKHIYIPTLWPDVLTNLQQDSIEYKYAANILPLPCDQRYTVDEMKYLVEELKKCID